MSAGVTAQSARHVFTLGALSGAILVVRTAAPRPYASFMFFACDDAFGSCYASRLAVDKLIADFISLGAVEPESHQHGISSKQSNQSDGRSRVVEAPTKEGAKRWSVSDERALPVLAEARSEAIWVRFPSTDASSSRFELNEVAEAPKGHQQREGALCALQRKRARSQHV